MPPKRKATYSEFPEVKKPHRLSPPPTSQSKATRDIRFFFTSQGSPSPKNRVTRQDSAAQDLKQEVENKKDKAAAAKLEKDASTDANAECPKSPPRDDSPSPPGPQSEEAAQKKLETPMLVKALEDAKDATTPTVQTSIESAVVVEEHQTNKKDASPAEPLSKEEEDAKPKFDKEKWAKENLTDEERELLGLEIQTLDASWFKVLKDELKSKSFLDLKRFLMAEHNTGKTIFPPAEDVYSWSRHTPLNTVKAVILGQDPYHNHNQAHGLCFSVRPPTPAPPSLKNIYKALAIEFPDFKPPANNGGLLTPWANRGVLMLNACLTVRAHNANSHANKGWERFTQKVIDIVASRKKGVVFLAWGLPAAKRLAKVDGKKHCILKGVHPSPLSAHRGFFELGHFKKCNAWLEEKYGKGKGIDWSLDVDPEEVGV